MRDTFYLGVPVATRRTRKFINADERHVASVLAIDAPPFGPENTVTYRQNEMEDVPSRHTVAQICTYNCGARASQSQASPRVERGVTVLTAVATLLLRQRSMGTARLDLGAVSDGRLREQRGDKRQGQE